MFKSFFIAGLLLSAPFTSSNAYANNDSNTEEHAMTIQSPSQLETSYNSILDDRTPQSHTRNSQVGRNIQIALNSMALTLQHLEVLNIYNCERWWCSGAPAIYLGLSAINYGAFFREHPVMIPTLIAATVGAGSLLFWDIEYWNISTRHRTEYYDTHNFYDNALWLNQFWSLGYLFFLKQRLRAPQTAINNRAPELTESEITELRSLLQSATTNNTVEPQTPPSFHL